MHFPMYATAAEQIEILERLQWSHAAILRAAHAAACDDLDKVRQERSRIRAHYETAREIHLGYTPSARAAFLQDSDRRIEA